MLSQPSTAAIVFVYRREGAEALARKLSDALATSVLAYHSGLSASERQRTRAQFRDGANRCLVATTALAMGVNLPATHVFVRDTTFFGSGKLRVDELLQILGRAGRGDRSGLGAVVVRQNDAWDADQLANALRDEALPPLRSSFAAIPAKGRTGQRGRSDRNGRGNVGCYLPLPRRRRRFNLRRDRWLAWQHARCSRTRSPHRRSTSLVDGPVAGSRLPRRRRAVALDSARAQRRSSRATPRLYWRGRPTHPRPNLA